MFDNWHRVFTANNIERLLVGDFLRTGELGGYALTILLGVLAILCATMLGLLMGLARRSNNRLIRWPVMVYINLFRSVPVLVIIFWAYFLPPQLLGVTLSAFESALIALSLFTSAYIAEIVRSGLDSISATQIGAGRALGLSRFQIYRYLIIPQAFFTMLPALSGRYVVTIKNTSLAFLIGLAELTEVGKQISSRLMTAPIEIYTVILVLYYVLNVSIGWLMGRLEKRAVFNRLFSPAGLRRLRAGGVADPSQERVGI